MADTQTNGQAYDAAQNGLHLPQNGSTNNNSITSPMSVDKNGSGGFNRRSEPNKRALYVGGLDTRVTEEVLRQIFETTGHVQSVKIIPDKHAKGFNYGFVEYDDPAAAERAMQTLNGRHVHQAEIRVNWAYQNNNNNNNNNGGLHHNNHNNHHHHNHNSPNHFQNQNGNGSGPKENQFHVFVGDLSPEVNDELLFQAFSAFGNIAEARVMWDVKTGRSRGFGFVAYADRADAEKAISSMDGEWLGSRAIRCNWANQKGQGQQNGGPMNVQQGMGMGAPGGHFNNHHQFPAQGMNNFDMVAAQTPFFQTTVYVGNLTSYTKQEDISRLFLEIGPVVEIRLQADRGFAFVKMDNHQNAAVAICRLNGQIVNSRPLKCSWGKDRGNQFHGNMDPAQPGFNPQQGAGFPTQHPPYYPQYGNM